MIGGAVSKKKKGGPKSRRFRVVITREMVEEWAMYVSAHSATEATELAERSMWATVLPEFDVIDAEYYLDARPIDPKHGVEPTRIQGFEGVVCAVCLELVEWTGASADDPSNTTGKTLPGPWRHSPRG